MEDPPIRGGTLTSGRGRVVESSSAERRPEPARGRGRAGAKPRVDLPGRDDGHGRRETSFTVGADYERRLSEVFGIGALVDLALGNTKRTALLGIPVFLHLIGALELHAAPAIEFADERGEGDTGEGSSDVESTTNFAVRVGAGYEFELGQLTVAPQVNVDFISGESASIVYGLAFGVGF